MKAKTVLVAALAGGVGYVLGTRAGREKYEEIKARANDLAHSQQAQDAAARVAAEVKERAASLPDPVANVINNAADAVAEAPKPDAAPGSTSSTTA
jgi:hypothetical protein